MAAGRPWTDADTARMVLLHGEGKTLTAIAKDLGRSKDTVSRHAASHEPPLSFDRTFTAAATVAKVVDAEARNVLALQREQDILEFEQALILAAQQGRQKWKTTLRVAGGAEKQVELGYIPPQDAERAHRGRSAIVSTIGKLRDLTTSHTKDLPAVDQWLVHMTGGSVDGG